MGGGWHIGWIAVPAMVLWALGYFVECIARWRRGAEGADFQSVVNAGATFLFVLAGFVGALLTQ